MFNLLRARGCVSDFSLIFEKLAEHLGIVYAIEEPSSGGPTSGETELTVERVRSLPEDLLAELRLSLEAGDVALAGKAVDRVEAIDALLAAAMRRSINAYSLDDLLELVGSPAG